MYYELYADSLWLLNFVMNLYLLLLVDRSLLRTATRARLILGAAVGATFCLLPFLWNTAAWLKYSMSGALGTVAMAFAAFRPMSARALAKILEKLFLYTFLFGGLFLFLMDSVPWLREKAMGVCGVMGLGAAGFLLISRLRDRQTGCARTADCSVVLIRNGCSVRVTALLDSGNSLVEPVSGKPVSVIDEKLYRELWREENVPFRAIPYQSIGRKRGILRGYSLPELKVEVDGMVKSFQNVYVAVGTEYAGDVRIILNPALMEESPQALTKRKNKLEMRN